VRSITLRPAVCLIEEREQKYRSEKNGTPVRKRQRGREREK
jgi:hypothetical protein